MDKKQQDTATADRQTHGNEQEADTILPELPLLQCYLRLLGIRKEILESDSSSLSRAGVHDQKQIQKSRVGSI
jgi:hypothetical protein